MNPFEMPPDPAISAMMQIALEVPELTTGMCETMADHENDLSAIAEDSTALEGWKAASPEARAAAMLFYAWNTRHIEVEGGPTDAERYAVELNRYAREHEGNSAQFLGESFPLPPLPGPAGRLATSLAFDEEPDTGMLAAFVLMSDAENVL